MIDDSLRVLIVSGGRGATGVISRLSGTAVEAALKPRFTHLAHAEMDDSLHQILDSFCPDVVFPVHLGDTGLALLRSFLGDSIPCVGSSHYQDAVNNCDLGRFIYVAVFVLPQLLVSPPVELPEPAMDTMYMSEPIIRAPLPPNSVLEAQMAAVEAHLKNDCVDYSLVELRVSNLTDGYSFGLNIFGSI